MLSHSLIARRGIEFTVETFGADWRLVGIMTYGYGTTGFNWMRPWIRTTLPRTLVDETMDQNHAPDNVCG